MTDAPQVPVKQASVFVQPCGAGNDMKFVIGQNARGGVGAYSGGGTSVESLSSFGRLVASRVTAIKGRVTTQITVPSTVASAMRALTRNPDNPLNLHVFAGCAPVGVDNFSLLRTFVDAFITGSSTSGAIVDGTTGEAPDQMEQIDIDALDLTFGKPLSHTKVGGAVSTGAFNHVIALPSGNCGGLCAEPSKQEFIAVGDPVSPATIPRIFYSADGGNTWVQQTIAAVANGAAEAVAVCGNRVIVACSGTNAGVFTASLTDVKLTTATFTLANGITTAHVYNDVLALDTATIIAVGAAGRIAVSTDGGFSFALLTSGTAVALNRVAAGVDKSIVWVGGAAGTLLRVKSLRVVEAVTLAGIGTDVIKALAVPLDRTNELYVGTDTGEIHRTRNAYASLPTWEELSFDKPSGGGIIEDIGFAETRQAVMFVVQSNGASQSRVLCDYSGGKMGVWATAFNQTFTSPANSIMNSIAPVSINFALTVGESGFIGAVAGVDDI